MLCVVLAFWISILKIFKSLPNYRHRAIDITSFEKHLESSSGHTLSQIWWNIVSRICFWRNLSTGLLRRSSLQHKEGQSEANFFSSGSKIVKRIRRRKYNPVIIERTMGIVLCPSTTLYRSFLKHGTLTNKAVGTIWRDVSKASEKRRIPDPRPLWLLCGTPSVLGLDLASRRAEHSLLWQMFLYILIYCFHHLKCLCIVFMASPLWLAVDPRSLYGGLFTNVYVSFWLHSFSGLWECWDPINRFNHSSFVAVVTPTNRPKSVRNHSLIEVLGGVLCCDVAFWIFLLVWGFCHSTESDLFIFLFIKFYIDEVYENQMHGRIWYPVNRLLALRQHRPSNTTDSPVCQDVVFVQ